MADCTGVLFASDAHEKLLEIGSLLNRLVPIHKLLPVQAVQPVAVLLPHFNQLAAQQAQ